MKIVNIIVILLFAEVLVLTEEVHRYYLYQVAYFFQ
jgi:hypothetical protein